MASKRILLVDDFEPCRRAISLMLKKQTTLHVVGEAEDGLEAVEKAQQLQPDLILLDIGLPALNGLKAARRIQELSPKSTILFVSENRSWDVVAEALRTGAAGFVVKSNAASELLEAVNAVLGGKRFVSASLAVADRYDEQTSPTATGSPYPRGSNPSDITLAEEPQPRRKRSAKTPVQRIIVDRSP